MTEKFQATPDQQEALDLMLSWLQNGYSILEAVSSSLKPNLTQATSPYRKFLSDQPYFLLKGFAGTGKTFLITELAKTGGFKPSEICFTAPTNKAVKVLRNYLDGQGLQNCEARTIYSLLGLSLQNNGEVKEIVKPKEPLNLSQYKVIIVDEGSMVNRFLLSAIDEAFLRWKIPFVFMGDPAQLPPVGEKTSPIWQISNSYALTKVLRYGDSMLELATSIRNIVDHPFPSIKIITNPPVYKVTRAEWFSSVDDNLDLILEGSAKILTWRNIKVDQYNAYVRKKLFGGPTAKIDFWLPTDKLVATSQVKDLEDNVILQTGEEAEVLEVVLGLHPKHPEFEIFNILARLETGSVRTVRALTPAGTFLHNNKLNELSTEAKSGKRYKWGEFWRLKEAFAEIRHSYALTGHGSQGSSYSKSFVDLEDILLNRERGEAFRNLYVTCTRQREELWLA
jgi:exodeoxyribonuclease-5